MIKLHAGSRLRKSIGAIAVLTALACAVLFSGGGAQAAGVPLNKAAVVKNTGGSVHWREGAGTGYPVKGTLVEGDAVTVLEGPTKDGAGQGWYRISVAGHIGWMDGRYLGSVSASAAKPVQAPAKAVQPAAQPAKQAPASAKLTGYAKVTNTGGDAIRVRSSLGGRVVGTASSGAVLKIVSGPSADKSGTQWYQVSGNGVSGLMSAAYLASAPAPKIVAASVPKPAPKVAAAPVPKAPPKPVAKPAPTPASKPVTKPAPAPAPAPAPVPGSSSSGVVSIAMRYVGYNYSYGGTTPAGFDCSGFVYYVFNKAGIPMGRTMGSELASGVHISHDQLQPGDLAYFAGTYRSGISHISIYIGGGQIVHAADYGIGVTVSNLSDAYWAAHYAGAIRVTR